MFHYFAVQSHNIEHPCQQFHRLSAVHFCNLSFYHDIALSIILAHFTVIVDHVEYLSSYLLIYIFVLPLDLKFVKKKKKMALTAALHLVVSMRHCHEEF